MRCIFIFTLVVGDHVRVGFGMGRLRMLKVQKLSVNNGLTKKNLSKFYGWGQLFSRDSFRIWWAKYYDLQLLKGWVYWEPLYLFNVNSSCRLIR